MQELFYLFGAFLLFVILQAALIIGLKLSFEKEHINEWWPSFVKRFIKSEKWQKPFYSCVRCMASVWGSISFWPVVIYFFGFDWKFIFVWLADIFIVSFIAAVLYKKV